MAFLSLIKAEGRKKVPAFKKGPTASTPGCEPMASTAKGADQPVCPHTFLAVRARDASGFRNDPSDLPLTAHLVDRRDQ